MLPYCPKCGRNTKMSAIHGKVRTVACLNCGQGWKTGINGSKSYDDEVVIEFGNVIGKMIVTCGKHRVRLAAIQG
jgi:uncharacterized Zn finger protein